MSDQQPEVPMFMDAPGGEVVTPAGAPAGQPQDVNVQMAADMVKHGAWSQDKADAFLANLSADPEHEEINPLAAAPKLEVPEGVSEIDALAFAPPKAISEYRFETPKGGQANQEQVQEVQQLFFAEGIPAPVANMVAKLYDQSAMSPPTAMQIQSATVQTMAKLKDQYGDDTERCIAAARGEVNRLAARNPKILDMLEVSALGSNFYVVQSLINLARARGRLK
jgi:hypothetical protein